MDKIVLYFNTEGIYNSQLIYQLSNAGFTVNYTKDFEDFEKKIKDLHVDLLVLEKVQKNIPLKNIKKQKGDEFPIVLIDEDKTKFKGVSKLSEVYFLETPEITNKIEMLINDIFTLNEDMITFENGFVYSINEHIFTVNNQEVSQLNPQEAKLLEYLLRHKHTYQNYEVLQKYLTIKEYISIDSLRTTVKNIRKKSYPKIITNLSGTGYKVNLPKQSKQTKVKILICDDQKSNVSFLKLLVIKNIKDVEIFTTYGGKEAIKVLEKEDINIVLLDIEMPDISGWDVAKYIKNELFYKNIATIFITSVFIDEEYKKEGFELGAVDYLTKPIDRNLLINRLKLYIKNFDQEQKIAIQNQKSKEQERLLLQKEVMLAQSNVLEKIAHHWRQPLNIISLSASGVSLNLEKNIVDTDKIKSAVDLIVNETNKLSQTIDEFQTFFAPQNEKNRFNISDCVSSVVELLRYNISQCNVDVILNLEDITVNSYENALKRILISVINNSLDVIVNRKVTPRFIKIETSVDDGYCIVNVIDNAGGVDKDIEQKVYEPYFSTKKNFNGTGMSLYLSQQIAQKYLNGKISNENIKVKFKNKNYDGVKFSIYIKGEDDEQEA